MMVPNRHMNVNALSYDRVDDTPVFPGAHALDRLGTATRALIKARELQQRVDTKFFGPVRVLEQVLTSLGDQYEVIRVASGALALYQSLYFDTPDLRCYHDHRRGRRIRHKVRIRHYPDRSLSFLEIKSKRNERVTDKHRLDLPFGTKTLDAACHEFLRRHCDLPVEDLAPTLDNQFRRIILLHREAAERVTIDVGLTFRAGDRALDLSHVVVVEVKQFPYSSVTPIMQALQGGGLREQSLSKYTAAMAHMVPGLRRNRLLPLLRTLDRITA